MPCCARGEADSDADGRETRGYSIGGEALESIGEFVEAGRGSPEAGHEEDFMLGGCDSFGDASCHLSTIGDEEGRGAGGGEEGGEGSLELGTVVGREEESLEVAFDELVEVCREG